MSGLPPSTTVIALASDHAGVALRRLLMRELHSAGHEILDLGPADDASVDYPLFAAELAAAMASGRAERGILVCGSGIGMSIAANRFPHIRAALCRDAEDSRLARRHNDANVLVLGARRDGGAAALDCLRAFLDTGFEGGRHARRVAMLTENTVPASGAALHGKDA